MRVRCGDAAVTTPESPSLAEVAALMISAMEAGKPHAYAMADVRRAYDMLTAYQNGRHRAMLTAVMADLDAIDVGKVPGGRTYRQTVLWLAEVIDKRGADDGPSTTAKLADQLTKVMQALTRRGGGEDDGYGDFEDAISTPVR
jgi:hypothetical protein